MSLNVGVYRSLEALPPSCQVIFAEAAAHSAYLAYPWFHVLTETTRDHGDRLRVYAVADAATGAAQAVLVARAPALRGVLAMRTLAGFSNFYSPLFSVVARADADVPATARSLAVALTGERPRWDAVHLKALDPDAAMTAALERSLGEAGLIVQSYEGFGNWFEPTAGISFQDYLARRPPALVNTVRRKERKLSRVDGLRFSVHAGPAEAGEGAAAYARVYANSWKQPEPYPRFMPALIEAAAGMGALRLGVVRIADEPVAAQVWITWQGKATIFKLAHDRRFDHLSVGSVLTMWMMRHALNEDRVAEVDFGVGDDPYKRTWLSQRRQRRGLLALNARTPRGGLGVLRHVVGHAARRAFS